ncbi:histidinol-phosphate transaminase [Lusitaniella coriacea LEGE 07157]|uniref:Histidinol-phosphate aminotransferase n=1 Tax=Lusitaniella coriacea LEGE 07157 TaxID=945747 RepID=A0A8J7J9J6_9CYAN|nr:histidinol-phosphate transaminase [Lusitaniella coriacea]MBE9115605.1 histidinol-phosphate transaminase [Lusitaniella coriacea LEGE 07157]
MLEFLRSDLIDLAAYTPHPGGKPSHPVDRLDTNESPFDLPKDFKEKLVQAYQEGIATNRYPDGSHGELKRAIAQYVNESAGLENVIDASRISVGNGSDELIRSLLIATCVGSDCSILVATPTFSMYGILSQTLGIPVSSVSRSETDFSINLGEAKYTVERNPLIRVVFAVHPNSPTANPLTQAEIEWLKSLPEQILVVIDEAYFEFSQTSVVRELEEHPNWVILRTFSKAFRLASLRVGYAIAHPDVTATLEKIRLPYNLPSFSQIAAQLALENRDSLLTVIPELLKERDRLFAAFSSHPNLQVWASSANFLYLRPRSPQLSLAKWVETLKSKGTLIRHTGGGLRVTVGTPEENDRTLERFQALK